MYSVYAPKIHILLRFVEVYTDIEIWPKFLVEAMFASLFHLSEHTLSLEEGGGRILSIRFSKMNEKLSGLKVCNIFREVYSLWQA